MARDVWGNKSIWGPGKPKATKKSGQKPVNNPMAKYAGYKKSAKKKTPKVKGVYPKAFTPIGMTGKPLKFVPKDPRTGASGQKDRRLSQVPDGYYARMRKLKAARDKARDAKKATPSGRSGSGSGGSGGGRSGGGGGGGRSGGSKKTKPQKPAPSTPQEPEFDINALFDPARKAIANQRVDIQQRKDASQKAWNDFHRWAEQKRAESAALVTSTNETQTKLANENRAAADARIAELVNGARGGTPQQGGAVAGGDLAAATGADALAQSQATLSTGQQASADWAATQGKIADQQMADRQAINNALAAEGTRNVELGAAQAFARNDKDLADLENTIAAAKLDQYNRDRAYELDKQAAEWLRTYQQKGLDLQGRQLDAEIEAGKASAAKALWDQQFEQLKYANEQARKTGDTLVDARKMLVDIAGDFENMGAHEQGQVMQEVGRALRAQYGGILTPEDASRLMASVFGRRYSNAKYNGADGGRSAIKDFTSIWNA